MRHTDTASFLQAAPEDHSRRSILIKNHLSAQRWPAAACGLRHAAIRAQDWAAQARLLAEWCDAQAATVQSTAAAPVVAVAGPVTLKSLEAGLMALASGLGPEHSARVLDAISSTFAATHAGRSLPAEAVVIGQALDHDSLEQGEPA